MSDEEVAFPLLEAVAITQHTETLTHHCSRFRCGVV